MILPLPRNRTIEPLEVAVDDPSQVVELLASGEADGPERFRLVAFTVAEEWPTRGRCPVCAKVAVAEVAVIAGVVNRHDRAEAHAHRRILPEVRHQPRVRVTRNAAAGVEAPAGNFSVLISSSRPSTKRPCVHAGAGVPWKKTTSPG